MFAHARNAAHFEDSSGCFDSSQMIFELAEQVFFALYTIRYNRTTKKTKVLECCDWRSVGQSF